jgi:hypothetical protein
MDKPTAEWLQARINMVDRDGLIGELDCEAFSKEISLRGFDQFPW